MYWAIPSCPVVHSTEQDLLGYFEIVGNSGHAESTVHSGMYHVLYHPIPWYMRTGWTVGLACWECVTLWGVPCAEPSYPMVHEDKMDNGISMLRVWYTVGCIMLYYPIPWYMRTKWTVGLACWEYGTPWDVSCCTILSHGTWGRDGQWD